MSTISTLIAQARAFVTTLRSSIWAIDVRDGIGDSIQKLSEAIEQCYSDVSNPTLQTEALEAALQNKIDQGEMAALTIGDHTITAEKLAQGVIDNTLATSGAAADAKTVGDELGAINKSLESLVPGLSQEAKAALLACFDHVYWTDDNGDTYYQALYDALYPASGLVSITAVFSPGTATIYSDDNLNTLKAYLTVTGLYENGQSKAITDYALSGSLSVGTNTITVSCDGKITTFSVSVASTLDRIAYGTLTYRDIFKTGNYFSLEGFEGIDEVPSVETALPNGDTFYGSYGSPAPFISSDYANKGVHSIKAFGSSSSQAKYTTSRMPTSGRVLLACSVYVERCTAGVCGVQFNIMTDSSHTVTKSASVSRATDGFKQIVTINDYDVSNGQSTALAEFFVGTWSRADADAYVDDVVIAIVPSEMTLETATTLYNNYISMI